MGETTVRSQTDGIGKVLYSDDDAADAAIITALADLAQARGVSMASLALAWHYTKPAMSAPIIGATKPHHLEAALAALEIELTDDEVAMLEGPYRPKSPTGMGMPLPRIKGVSVL